MAAGVSLLMNSRSNSRRLLEKCILEEGMEVFKGILLGGIDHSCLFAFGRLSTVIRRESERCLLL